MIEISEVLEGLTALIDNGEHEFDVITEFPSGRQTFPLKKPVISVGVNTLKILPADDNSYIAYDTSECILEIGVNICCPKTYSGSDIYGLTEYVIGCLYEYNTSDGIYSVEVEPVKYASTIGALTEKIIIKVDIGSAY